MTGELADRLELPMMVDDNTSQFETGFTISIEAREGVTTGISAADRARTVQAAVADGATAHDLVRPGHIFPLRARQGGVMVRIGPDRGVGGPCPALQGLNLPVSSVRSWTRTAPCPGGHPWRSSARSTTSASAPLQTLSSTALKTESFVRKAAQSVIPTQFGGDFKIIAYENDLDNLTHIAMVKGEIDPDRAVLVRVHSECMTGDIFGSLRCDCGEQLHKAMGMMDKEGSGVVLYLRQEGRGIGLVNKLKAYRTPAQGV